MINLIILKWTDAAGCKLRMNHKIGHDLLQVDEQLGRSITHKLLLFPVMVSKAESLCFLHAWVTFCFYLCPWLGGAKKGLVFRVDGFLIWYVCYLILGRFRRFHRVHPALPMIYTWFSGEHSVLGDVSLSTCNPLSFWQGKEITLEPTGTIQVHPTSLC